MRVAQRSSLREALRASFFATDTENELKSHKLRASNEKEQHVRATKES